MALLPQADELRFVRKIDSGGWAEVWLAEDVALGRQVAVKFFEPQSPTIASAARHAQALARIAHPNVVVVYGVGQLPHPDDHEERDAIVMEYVPGDTLCARLAGPPLAQHIALTVARGLAEGLQAIHAANTAHGDLHDENVIVMEDGTVKIIDILERFTLRHAPTITREQCLASDVRAVSSLLRDVLRQTTGVHRTQRLAFDEISDIDSMATAFERAVLGDLTHPDVESGRRPPPPAESLIERTKKYLSDPRYRIRLSYLLSEVTEAYLTELGSPRFDDSTTPNAETLSARIYAYDDAVETLMAVSFLVSRWGNQDATACMLRSLATISGSVRRPSYTAWEALQWYPMMRVVYAIGIACDVARDYRPLFQALQLVVQGQDGTKPLIERIPSNILELARMNAFQSLFEAQHRFPLSAHVLTSISGTAHQLLHVGPTFERHFDRFEMLYSLAVAHYRSTTDRQVWGPVGRFAYRDIWRSSTAQLDAFHVEVTASAESQILAAGFFGGSSEQLTELVESYKQVVLAHVRRF